MNLEYSEYKAIVESSPIMIWRAGTDAKCNYFNETWLRFTGRTAEQEAGDGWAEGVHLEDIEMCLTTFTASFNNREAFEMEYRLRRHDGQWRWINDRGVPFFGEDGSFIGYIGSCMDVTEKIEGIKLADMAHNDKLTGLYNRNYLDYLLGYEFHNAGRTQTDLVIMMLDIDRFKYVNDHYGHGIGDRVLNQVAAKITENTRKSDIVGRYGGDEFLVVLPSATIESATAVAVRILNSVSQLTVDDVPGEISVSIGIASRSNEKEAHEVVEKADCAMYRAKRDGGSSFRLFEETLIMKN